MLLTLFSVKGSPGVTSAALALSAVWPRPVVLVEADPAGGDLIYRCRTSAGGRILARPNILGLAAAVRRDRHAPLAQWGQELANGVTLVAGVSSAAESRGLAGLWPALAAATAEADVDVIVDLGRTDRESPSSVLSRAADVVIPVMAASLESLTHMRAALKDQAPDNRGEMVPLLVSAARTAGSDRADVDEVLVDAGLFAAPCAHLVLDHPGLTALERGAKPTGRGRISPLVRSARAATLHIQTMSGAGVGQ